MLDLLSQLVEKSLVLYEEQGREGRYRFLETVRQYGRERLLEAGEAAAVRQRHADNFLHWAQQWDQGLFDDAAAGSLATRLDRMETEYDNVRAALVWARVEGQVEMLLRLAAAVRWFWMQRGDSVEGHRWLEEALERSRELGSSPLRARVLEIASNLFYSTQGNFRVAYSLTEQLLEMQIDLGNKDGVAFAYWQMGLVARDQAEYDRARTYYQ